VELNLHYLGVVSTFAGSGERGIVNGLSKIAKFSQPQAIAVGNAGNVFVMDNTGIRKISNGKMIPKTDSP